MTNILFGVALLASLAACSSDRLRAIGGSCGTSSDCPSQQICEDSYCVFPCTVDADCPYNLVCDGRICAVERRVPGPTVPPPEPVPSCEGEPDGTACTQPSDEAGYCFEGDCVECLVNDHCGGSAQCARAQCTDDHFCNVVTLHDGIGDGSAADAGWVSEPVLSPEYTLTNITTRMSDIAWDGQNFLVVFRAADSWFAARIAPDGTVVDTLPWSIGPGFYGGLAFDGTKYLVLGFDTDADSGNTVVTYHFVSPAGAPLLGGVRLVDGACRGGANTCGPMSVSYAAGRFLVLYAGPEWRTTKYALIDTAGGVAKIDNIPAPTAYSGYYASAAFDGQRFAVAFADETHFSNACEIFGTKIKPDGSDGNLARTPLRTIAQDFQMSRTARLFAGSHGLLLAYDNSVNTIAPNFTPGTTPLSGLGSPSWDSGETYRPTFDGANYVLVADGPWAGSDCGATSVCATRVTQDNKRLDVEPFRISSDDAAEEHSGAVVSHGAQHAVAYGKEGVGIVVRFFSTCP